MHRKSTNEKIHVMRVTNLAKQAAEAQIELESIISKISEMDVERAALEVNNSTLSNKLESVNALFINSNTQCNLTDAGSSTCVEARKNSCTALENIVSEIKTHHQQMKDFNDDNDYEQLKAHEKFEDSDFFGGKAQLSGDISDLVDNYDANLYNCSIS